MDMNIHRNVCSRALPHATYPVVSIIIENGVFKAPKCHFLFLVLPPLIHYLEVSLTSSTCSPSDTHSNDLQTNTAFS
jgi:hypothetical protein